MKMAGAGSHAVTLLAQLFEPVEIEMFLKWFGPILRSKWTYFGSKIGIFGPKCTKKA